MRPDADLSQQGVANILGDFLDALDLHDVTLVLNDWGGGQFLINADRTDRIARMALVACEAFDNLPPKAARPLAVLSKVPPLFTAALQLLRMESFRRDERRLRRGCRSTRATTSTTTSFTVGSRRP